MQGINGFSPPPLSFGPLPLVKGGTERGLQDARFLQSIIEVACGQKASNPVVYAGQGGSQPDFFTNPQKVANNPNQKKEKNIDDILAKIEKILSQIKEENK
jgi:hypothetical protein